MAGIWCWYGSSGGGASRVRICRFMYLLSMSAGVQSVGACPLTYPSTPRRDVAGSFVLQDGLHGHWCTLSLFVEPLQFVQLPCEGACMHAKPVLRCLLSVAGIRCALAGS